MPTEPQIRNAKEGEQFPKQKRLQSLARRAGDLCVSAYLGGNRDRAVFFLNKMNRILKMVRDLYKGSANA